MAARSSVGVFESSISLPHPRVSSHCRAPCASCSPLTLKPYQHRSVRVRASDPTDVVVDELIDQASEALVKAREALADVQRAEEFLANTSAPTFIPSTLTFGAPLSEQQDRPNGDSGAPSGGPSVAQSRAEPTSRAPTRSESNAPGSTGAPPRPVPAPTAPPPAASSRPSSVPPPPASGAQGDQPWGDSTDSKQAPTMTLQRQRVRSRRNNQTDFAEPNYVQELSFPLQPASEAKKTLEEMQSVKQLTFAHLPPTRAGEAAPTEVSEAAEAAGESEVTLRGESEAGHVLPDGKGVLADGSTYEKMSGEETGDNGYWCRWWVMRGTALGGKVEWEETWWESSDWAGMREMGAQKVGCNASGDAWREAWKERVDHIDHTGEPCVERSAHKWAKDDVTGEQWEEKWGEHYAATGGANKWAEKWGRRGADVWHEKWGEDYAAGNDGNLKWTDRWSETVGEDGNPIRSQGDKWREEFGGGTGSKNGETWFCDEGGHRYNRLWGENHFGDGWVQKYGHSTAGEHWDSTEQSGTYYNPAPHFTFQMALDHSPDLLEIPVRPREATLDDFLGGGMDNF